MNRIGPPSLRRAFMRAAIGLLFTLALLTSPLAATSAAQRDRASRKRRANAAKQSAARSGRTAATVRKSAAKRKAVRTEPAGELLQSPRYEQEIESDDAEKRENWFYFERAYPFGEIPADARRRA